MLLKDKSQPSTVTTDPAYSSATKSKWSVGNGSGAGDSYSGIDTTDLNAATWGVRLQRMRLAAGTYTMTGLVARVAYSTSGDWANQKLVIATRSGSTFTVAHEIDLDDPASPTDGSYTETFTPSGDGVFTVAATGEYYFGLAIQGAAGRTTGRPGNRYQTGSCGGDASYSADITAGEDLPSSFTGSALSSGEQWIFELQVETANRIVYSGDIASGDEHLLPSRFLKNSDAMTTIKLSDVVVTDGNALTLTINDFDGDAVTTIVLDFGATDQITAGGNNIALTGEAGDTFDIMIQRDRWDAEFDVYYLNRSTGQGAEGAADFATISHAAKHNDARDTRYSLTGTYAGYMVVSGTGTIGGIEIGWEPVIIFGDSMASFSNDRIGDKLPTAFTYDRIYWRADISGNRLASTASSSHTSGLQRFKNDTVGNGDLIEIQHCLFVFAMYGLNDISQIGTTKANYSTVTADYFEAAGSILSDLSARGNDALVMGLAPYHDASNASELEASAIQLWNSIWESVCKAQQVAFFNPWFDLVDPDTQDNAIPEIRSDYTSDGGTHINASAATVASSGAVQSYESGFVYEMAFGESVINRRLTKAADRSN